jgi:ATP-dependent RNA helicase MSS116
MILDEADRLLEMGFKEDIEMIASFLPNKKQSFLFSATISNDVKAIAQKLLLPGHKYIDTVPENEEPTHLKIKQSFMISPHSKQLFLLYQIIRKHMEEQKGGKIIVFFPTTKVVALMTEIFSKFPGLDIIDMHSQLTQYTREKKSDRFRRSTSAIMFTSDVSARGVDYPGVSLVVQMGAPSNRDSYIHRVGRTGRAGKEGEGILILSSFEEKFMDQISDIPIKQDYRFEAPLPIEIQEEFRNILSSFSNGHRIAAYMAMANYYYHGCNLKLSGETVLALSRDFARGILGLAELPTLPPYLAARLSSGRKNSPRMDQSSALYAKYKNITRESNDRGRDFKHDRGSGYDRGFRGYDRGKSENGFRGYDRGKSENGFRGYDRGKSENGFRGYDRGKNENGFRGYDRGKSDNGFRGYDRGKSDNGFSERIKMKGQYNF